MKSNEIFFLLFLLFLLLFLLLFFLFFSRKMEETEGKKRRREEEEKPEEPKTVDPNKTTSAPRKRRKTKPSAPEKVEYVLSQEEKDLAARYDEWKKGIFDQGHKIQTRKFSEKFVSLSEKIASVSLPRSEFEMKEKEDGTAFVEHIKELPEVEIEKEILKKEVIEALDDMTTLLLSVRLTVPSASDSQTFHESVKIKLLGELRQLRKYFGMSLVSVGNIVRNRAEVLRMILKVKEWEEDHVMGLKRLDEVSTWTIEQFFREFKMVCILSQDIIHKNLMARPGSRKKGSEGVKGLFGRARGRQGRIASSRRYSSNII